MFLAENVKGAQATSSVAYKLIPSHHSFCQCLHEGAVTNWTTKTEIPFSPPPQFSPCHWRQSPHTWTTAMGSWGSSEDKSISIYLLPKETRFGITSWGSISTVNVQQHLVYVWQHASSFNINVNRNIIIGSLIGFHNRHSVKQSSDKKSSSLTYPLIAECIILIQNRIIDWKQMKKMRCK